MEKNNQTGSAAQGAANQEVPELTVETVEKWLIDDIGRVRKLIETIHNDPNICRLIAVHLHGQAQNFIAAKKSAEAVSNEA